MSNFAGLETARKGLTVSQKAIELTGHNIANANTPGYTRQRLTIEPIEPTSYISRFAQSAASQIGMGVRIVNVTQIRNKFLDSQFRQEMSLSSEWSTRSETLGYIESLFDEASDTGLSASLSQFSASLQELAKSPASTENRANVLQNAISLTETLQHFASQLSEKQQEQDQVVATITGQVNSLAQSIADLNSQINLYELNGQNANDLRDQRNLKLDELSALTDFTSDTDSQGRLQIYLGDQMLVNHNTVRLLENNKTVTNPLTGEANALNSVVWADSGTAVDISSGSLRATLNLRDGNSQDEVGIPYIGQQLNQLAVSLADTFNAIHEAGWSLPNTEAGTVSATGITFFTTKTDALGAPLPMSAATIRVNPDIESNLALIAASGQQVTSDTLKGNNQNVLALGDIFGSGSIAGIGSFSGFISSLVSTIAVETQQASSRAENQLTLVDSIELQRQSVSGVSLDEETTNLIKYQHSYTAAARVITTIDEMLDVLINKTGVVGR